MSGAGTRRPVYNKELFRVPVQELPPDASQYRIVMLFRHIEDAPKEIPPELETLELQYHLLEHNYNIHFKLHLKDGIAPVNNVRVHYMLASPQALMEMVGTTQVTLDMVCTPEAAITRKLVTGQELPGVSPRDEEEDQPDDQRLTYRTEGRGTLQFAKFLSGGRRLTQMKQDMLVTVYTRRLGQLKLSLSVGIVKDPVSFTVKEVYSNGNGIFWPLEGYHDCTPLPQAWMGTISGSTRALEEEAAERRRMRQDAEREHKRQRQAELDIVQQALAANDGVDDDESESDSSGDAPAQQASAARTLPHTSSAPQLTHGKSPFKRPQLQRSATDRRGIGGGAGRGAGAGAGYDARPTVLLEGDEEESQYVSDSASNSSEGDAAEAEARAKYLALDNGIMPQDWQGKLREVFDTGTTGDNELDKALNADARRYYTPPSSRTVTNRRGAQRKGRGSPPMMLGRQGSAGSASRRSNPFRRRQASARLLQLDTTLMSKQRARRRWVLVRNHIRGGSFRRNGLARGGTQGKAVRSTAKILIESVRKLVRGAEWLRAAASLARVVRMSDLAASERTRKPGDGQGGARDTELSINSMAGHSLTWEDLVKVLHRPDIMGSASESLIRKGFRENILHAIFDRTEQESFGCAELGELRAHVQALAGAKRAWKSDDMSFASSTRHSKVSTAQMQRFAGLLMEDESIKAKFDAFDEEATGTITYPEFVSMASQAFANASEPPHPLSGTRPGKCMRHGSTTVFASDGFCVTCEMDALEHQDELLPTGTGGGGGGAAGERGGAATPDASWLKAWAVRKPKRLTDKVRGPAVSLLRKAAGEAAQPAKKKISRAKVQSKAAEALMRGEKRKVPRLRVLVQAMRAKNAMTKRSRSYRARREAAKSRRGKVASSNNNNANSPTVTVLQKRSSRKLVSTPTAATAQRAPLVTSVPPAVAMGQADASTPHAKGAAVVGAVAALDTSDAIVEDTRGGDAWSPAHRAAAQPYLPSWERAHGGTTRRSESSRHRRRARPASATVRSSNQQEERRLITVHGASTVSGRRRQRPASASVDRPDVQRLLQERHAALVQQELEHGERVTRGAAAASAAARRRRGAAQPPWEHAPPGMPGSAMAGRSLLHAQGWSHAASAPTLTTAAVLGGRNLDPAAVHSGAGYDDGIAWPDAGAVVADAQARLAAAAAARSKRASDDSDVLGPGGNQKLLTAELKRERELERLMSTLHDSREQQRKSNSELSVTLARVKADMLRMGLPLPPSATAQPQHAGTAAEGTAAKLSALRESPYAEGLASDGHGKGSTANMRVAAAGSARAESRQPPRQRQQRRGPQHPGGTTGRRRALGTQLAWSSSRVLPSGAAASGGVVVL